jgi:hypothetical protein
MVAPFITELRRSPSDPTQTRTWLFAVMPWTTRRLRSAWHDELGIAFRSARSSALSSMAAELLDVHLTTRRALGCALKWDCQLCRSPTP